MNQALLETIDASALRPVRESVQARQTLALTGMAEGQTGFIASRLAADGLRVLLVTGNDLQSAAAAADARQLMAEGAASLPGGELDLVRGASSHESSWQRIAALRGALSGETRLLSCSMDALMQRMGAPEPFSRAVLRLRPGDRLAPDELTRRLVRMGYERVDLVEGRGQCAVRGAIVDVFSPGDGQPCRIEYFDDEIDTIRAFDPISQRSQEQLDGAELIPASEILLEEAEASGAAERMRAAAAKLSGRHDKDGLLSDLPPLPEDEPEDEPDAVAAAEFMDQLHHTADLYARTAEMAADCDLVEAGVPFRRIRTWLPVLTDEVRTLLDWFPADVIVLCDPDALRQRASERQKGFAEDLANAVEHGDAVQAQEKLLLPWEELLPRIAQGRAVIAAASLTKGLGGLKPDTVLNLDSLTLTGYRQQLRDLAADVRGWLEQHYAVALLSGGEARGERLQATLAELGVEAAFSPDAKTLAGGQAVILPMSLSHGFVWPEARLALVSDTDIWGAGYRRSKSRRNSGERIAAFTDLAVGDYVVHEDHGVGIYQGTVQLSTEGTSRDYLLIRYDGDDKLYVPIDQLQRVQRYIGNPNQRPKLNRIGSGDWNRQKGKVREGLKELAFDLVQLYAQREKTEGHAFPPDTPWQREFDDEFPYELTPDQQQSVAEITADMESRRNMDRLLIGDVGYGKTEVSLRAAFKAVVDGKQVAILAPTTILAQQHYMTVKKRFEHFPVRAEVLSRFRTAKEQKQILADLAQGKIDILVGTHRLLAKDVKFRDLGLLVVDEEQRFGVQHKETIKNLKHQVDVLTLTATPIPRTLHMSLSGIRDMSVLQTPPEDRLPVQTRVLPYSDALVRDAILRELSRGGQVYFLYNRVRSIEKFYERLHALVPEARIGVAHGQMRENSLEDVMMDFYAGSYDILLCTTIIESGLDVPTANTLIVFDADRFGLSQLYQLRGRVGRSSRQAYAYFTYREDKVLSETAQQRLSAIREFTEFGAGFRIALRDLEIRGAGNLLGPQQHGHLETVGYEMYCRLMEETLLEARGEISTASLETRIDLHVDAFLPQDYISDEHQRMEMYKRIASLQTAADREDILDELVDRFGTPPPPTLALLDISELRALCNRVGIQQVMMRQGVLQMRMDGRYVPKPMLLFQSMRETDPRLAFTRGAQTAMVLKDRWPSEAHALKDVLRVMQRLNRRLDELIQEDKRQSAEEGEAT